MNTPSQPRLRKIASVALLLTVVCFTFLAGNAAGQSSAAPEITLILEPFADDLLLPTDIAFAPGEDAAYVTELAGVIQRIADGEQTPFLDITARVGDDGPSHGLLGLAFHPHYRSNGYFFVYYTDLNLDTQISRFSANSQGSAADPTSEKMILHVSQPTPLHEAGDLFFGPDGYLYIPLGDGGPQNDTSNNAQNPQSLLGKLLRIDIDSAGNNPYAIPADNPFVADPDTLDEIWALGLRNPWRGSFDRETGRLFLADVGWQKREEINLQPAGLGGQNYGWSCYEGTLANLLTVVPDCGPPDNYTKPIAEYAHRNEDCSVTGGYVYRGSRYPDMVGRYFFTDFCSGNFGDLRRNGAGEWLLARHRYLSGIGLVTFGEDNDGELYVANIITGEIFHLISTNEVPATYRHTIPMLLNISADGE